MITRTKSITDIFQCQKCEMSVFPENATHYMNTFKRLTHNHYLSRNNGIYF